MYYILVLPVNRVPNGSLKSERKFFNHESTRGDTNGKKHKRAASFARCCAACDPLFKCPVLRRFSEGGSAESRLVSRAGIEPTTSGLGTTAEAPTRAFCLFAHRHATQDLEDFSSALAVSLTALAWGLPWHTGGSRVISRPFGNADTNRRERSDVRSGD